MQKQLKNITNKKFNNNIKFNIKKYKKIYYIGIFKKTLNNFFITIMDNKGQVIITKSAGNLKIFNKKKKKSFDTVKSIALNVAKIAIIKNIKTLKKFYITHSYFKNTYTIFNAFRFGGLSIKKAIFIKKKIHGHIMRKRKIRRI